VSCDPRSLAGDAALLIHGGYRLAGLSLVDMFPQTLHVECVASFIRSTCWLVHQSLFAGRL